MLKLNKRIKISKEILSFLKYVEDEMIEGFNSRENPEVIGMENMARKFRNFCWSGANCICIIKWSCIWNAKF